VKVGGETVLFRHEKRFENPPPLAMLISDSLSEAEVDNRLDKMNKFQYERVGLILRPEMLALKCDSGQPDKFLLWLAGLSQRVTAALS
jgi:acetyl-CoA decarbonylase/synthase complex subunit gamma